MNKWYRIVFNDKSIYLCFKLINNNQISVLIYKYWQLFLAWPTFPSRLHQKILEFFIHDVKTLFLDSPTQGDPVDRNWNTEKKTQRARLSELRGMSLSPRQAIVIWAGERGDKSERSPSWVIITVSVSYGCATCPVTGFTFQYHIVPPGESDNVTRFR